jgi:hypothetical protein
MKRLLLIAAALFVATGAFAQNVNWGAKAGLNLAKVNSYEAKPSFYLGIFTEFRGSNNTDVISFQPELVYSRQGYMSGSTKKGYVRLNYINMPLIIKLYIRESADKKWGLNIDLGPQLGYMVAANRRRDGITINMLDDSNSIERFDISIAAGLTIKIAKRLDLSARYIFGLLPVITAENKLTITTWGNSSTIDLPDVKQYNRVWQIGLGVRF